MTDEKELADSNLPFIEKYRPSNLQDLIAHEEIIQILNKFISTNKLPHLLFYGPPGTGLLDSIKKERKKSNNEIILSRGSH